MFNPQKIIAPMFYNPEALSTDCRISNSVNCLIIWTDISSEPFNASPQKCKYEYSLYVYVWSI